MSRRATGRGGRQPRPGTPRRRVGLRLRVDACLRRLRCEACGLPLVLDDEPASIEWDHEIPLALGGAHDAANIRPLHAHCHSLKSAEDAGRVAKSERQSGRSGQQARQAAGRRAHVIASRPFPTNRSGPFKKRLDGEVERRDRSKSHGTE